MFNYIVRRILYAIPILIGVNLVTFMLFFIVNSPNEMAKMHLGGKHVTPEAIENWKKQHGYDLPLFYNKKVVGVEKLTQTLFFKKNTALFTLNLGQSDTGRDIRYDIRQRMVPSLVIAIPIFFIGLFVNIVLALLQALFRGTTIDSYGVIVCTILMSISSLFYIICGQYVFAKVMKLVPISGYAPGWDGLRFVVLPVIVAVLSSVGANTRWYRAIFLEEISRNYVKTARAKGLSELKVLFKHVFKNALIPILTGVVVVIPSLFLGSLILESFFGIPGLGSYMIDAIQQQDFAIVRTMVFIGSAMYILGLILTDISYTLVDPRVRFK